MKLYFKKFILVFMCSIIVFMSVFTSYKKPSYVPQKVNAAEVAVTAYVLEEVVYFLLTTVIATLGIYIAEEAAPMLQDLYNGFLDDYQDKLDSGVIVDDDETQVKVGGFIIWKNTLDELERMDDLMFGSGGNGKKPPTDPDDQEEEILEIKEYIKKLGYDETFFINGAFLDAIYEYLESVLTPDSSLDSVQGYYKTYGKATLVDQSVNYVSSLPTSTNSSGSAIYDIDFDTVYNACLGGANTLNYCSPADDLSLTEFCDTHGHYNYNQLWYLTFPSPVLDSDGAVTTYRTYMIYGLFNNKAEFNYSKCYSVPYCSDSTFNPRLAIYATQDSDGGIILRVLGNYLDNMALNSEWKLYSTYLADSFTPTSSGGNLSMNTSSYKYMYNISQFVVSIFYVYTSGNNLKYYPDGQLVTLGSASTISFANPNTLDSINTNLPIYVNDKDGLNRYLKGDSSALDDAYNAEKTYSLPCDSLDSRLASSIADTELDLEVLPAISTLSNETLTSSDTSTDTTTTTQPSSLPENYEEVLGQGVKVNVSLYTKTSTSTQTKIDPLPDIEPSEKTETKPTVEIDPTPTISVEDDSINNVVQNGLSLKMFFPFCIPLDIANLIGCFKADAVAPVFEVPFKFERLGIDYVVVFDMTKFDYYFEFCRNVQCLLFIFGLCFATKKFI